jgi:hypothetical protein
VRAHGAECAREAGSVFPALVLVVLVCVLRLRRCREELEQGQGEAAVDQYSFTWTSRRGCACVAFSESGDGCRGVMMLGRRGRDPKMRLLVCLLDVRVCI